MEEMHGLKDIKRNEFFVSGHGACPGCGIAIAIKNVMRILGPDATVYVPARCAVVFSAQARSPLASGRPTAAAARNRSWSA